MGVTVQLDFAGVHAKLDGLASDPGLGQLLAMEAMRGMDPYVPFRNGYLAASATPSPWAISYTMPYAARLYDGSGLTISHERHALATSHWAEAYQAAHVDELAQAGIDYLRSRA